MKYVIEVEADSEKGAKLIQYIKELAASDPNVHFMMEPALTDEEVAMPPTRKVSQATLDAYLAPRDDEEEFTIEEFKQHIKEQLEELRKNRKDKL